MPRVEGLMESLSALTPGGGVEEEERKTVFKQ